MIFHLQLNSIQVIILCPRGRWPHRSWSTSCQGGGERTSCQGGGGGRCKRHQHPIDLDCSHFWLVCCVFWKKWHTYNDEEESTASDYSQRHGTSDWLAIISLICNFPFGTSWTELICCLICIGDQLNWTDLVCVDKINAISQCWQMLLSTDFGLNSGPHPGTPRI